MIRNVHFALVLILCAACKKEEPPPPETQIVAPAPEVSQPSAAPAAATVDVENLPVEEDFEAEAEKDVTASNLNQKLDELEKEIAAE